MEIAAEVRSRVGPKNGGSGPLSWRTKGSYPRGSWLAPEGNGRPGAGDAVWHSESPRLQLRHPDVAFVGSHGEVERPAVGREPVESMRPVGIVESDQQPGW